MAKRPLMTLLTDFGTSGPYVAEVKGAVLRGCPQAAIVDITHEVPPQDVLSAAFVLAQAAPQFPPSTVHVVVVDPGVGTNRNILAARYGEQTFLFPDNGVISFVADVLGLQSIAVVRNANYLPAASPSRTFHGRDLFAPVAAHLLKGVSVDSLGPQPPTYKLLETPTAERRDDGTIAGEVLYVDRFGNLVSNIPEALVRRAWARPDRIDIRCDGRSVGPMRGTYAEVPADTPLGLINSMGVIEVAVNGGSAAETLSAGIGSEITIVAVEERTHH